jgi:hypothetical protein
MILPTKRLPQDRALLAIGADILLLLSRPETVSKLWEGIKKRRSDRGVSGAIPFDWFLLGISFLYAIRAIDFRDGRLHRSAQ